MKKLAIHFESALPVSPAIIHLPTPLAGENTQTGGRNQPHLSKSRFLCGAGSAPDDSPRWEVNLRSGRGQPAKRSARL